MATSVTHFPVNQGESLSLPQHGTTTTEEIINLPDGSQQRVTRTVKVIVQQDTQPARRVVTQNTTKKTILKPQRSVTIENGHQQQPPRQQQQQPPQPTIRVVRQAEPPRTKAASALHKTPALDIPYADEVGGELDVPFDLVPHSQNTPRLIRAASMKKKKTYSITDAKEDFTDSVPSPRVKIDKATLPHQTSFIREGPRVERKPRPHTYHSGFHGGDGYQGSPVGYYGSQSSANSSFVDETDGGDVFSFEHQPQQMATYITPAFSLNDPGLNHGYSPERSPNRGSKSDSTSSLPESDSRRYKQHSNKHASLNRAASLQLRAYKTKSVSAARTASMSDEWLDEKYDPTPRNKQPLRRRSWSTGQFTLKECKTCNEKHTRIDGLLSFDEFHDHFFHTQWPAQTIMLCELKFSPSNKIIKLKVTSCNRFSLNKKEDSAKHAEIFFSEFLHEKVIPNLIGGDLEKLDINIWMNNSPCNQPSNKCSQALLEAFETVQSIIADSRLTLAFCHMTDLMNHEEPTRSCDLSGLVRLMSDPGITVRPFNGYDWMELLMIRTKQSEKWLRLANSDLRALIEERSEKDQETRACLRQMVIDFKQEISYDITHVKKAMARINHI